MMWLAMFMLCGMTGYAAETAQSVLSIDPVSFSNKDKKMVAVNFENKEPIAGMQFDVILPSFLEFDGDEAELNPERIKTHYCQMNPRTGRVIIYSMPQATIQGEDGALVYLPVKVKGNVSQSQSGSITVKGIVYSGVASSGNAQQWSQPTFTVQAAYSPYHVTVTPSSDKVSVKPGTPTTIGFNFEADCQVVGFQLDIVMPEGLKLDAESIVKSNRCPSQSVISLYDNGTFYRVVFADMRHKGLTGDSGEVFTINFNSDATYSVAAAEIEVQNIQISNQNDEIVIADPFSIQAVNETPLYQTLTAAVANLETALQTALATIAQECPDVADQYDGSELSSRITRISQDIENYYAAGNLTENAAAINTAIAGVEAAINAYVEAAKAAEAQYKEEQRQAANQAAYDATLAKIAALQTELNNAKAKCEQDYPGIDITANVQAAQAAIDAAKAGALTAFNAVAEAGTYEYTLDETGIKALIAKVLSDAKTAYDQAQEEARQAANQAAYDAALAKINALQASLDATVAQVNEQYDDVDVTAEITAAQNAINKAKADALAAFNAVAEVGTFNYEVPETEIQGQINAILTAAATASENNRKTFNQDAYNAALASIDELQTKLNAAIQYAEEHCPHANVVAQVNEAQTAITNARNDAKLAFLACENSGLFNFTVPVEEIETLIQNVRTSADAKEAEWVENQRKEANLAAYNESLSQIQTLQTSLNNMKAKVQSEFPDYDATADVNAAQLAINDAKAAADAEYASVESAGNYDYDVPVDSIQALIQQIYDNAKSSGILGIEMDNLEEGTMIFNLNGHKVTRPAPGTVVIVIKANGQRYKCVVR